VKANLLNRAQEEERLHVGESGPRAFNLQDGNELTQKLCFAEIGQAAGLAARRSIEFI
jgi:hypothetical protein